MTVSTHLGASFPKTNFISLPQIYSEYYHFYNKKIQFKLIIFPPKLLSTIFHKKHILRPTTFNNNTPAPPENLKQLTSRSSSQVGKSTIFAAHKSHHYKYQNMLTAKRTRNALDSTSDKRNTDQISSSQLDDDIDNSSNIGTQDFDQVASQGTTKRRSERSLDVLTHKFVDLILTKDNYMLDLNQAATTLKVHKRRIYDITNVLQGIGYIQKIQKNVTKWIGSTADPLLQSQICQHQKQLKRLQVLDQELTKSIRLMKQKLFEQFIQNEQVKQYLYITSSDCQQLVKKIEIQENERVLIVSTPKGSVIQMMDGKTKEDPKTMVIKSEKQPIITHYCGPNEHNHLQQQKPQQFSFFGKSGHLL